ncbi:efflux RND transporter periplasmic adaptor subunit [Kaarinaea lacus]
MDTACSRRLLLVVIFLAASIYSVHSLAASARTPLVVVDEARTSNVVKQVPLTGTVTSPKVGHLSAQVSGHVKTVKVDIGDRVKKGDVLLELDREIEELTLQATRAATEQARAQLADARRRYESAKRLEKENNISIDEIQNREAEVNINAAAVERFLAEEKKQQALVDRHTVKAPFSGVISEKLVEAGEWIEPGNPVVTLVGIDELRIDFQVPQEFFTNIDKQSQINVTLDALPGKSFEGQIDAVVPVSDPSARTFLMRVQIDKQNIRITPGMSVHGTLRLNTGQQGVVVSRDAIMRYPDGRVTVWAVKLDSEVPKVYEQPVKVGHSFNGRVAISEGLQSGTIVVVQGNESLQEGQIVQIHEPR